MDKTYAILSKICKGLDKAILVFSGTCLGLLTLIIFVQVVCRYVFHYSLSWSEEIARYLEVWIVFLSGAYALGHGQHVAMDLIISRAPPKASNIMLKFHSCLFIFFSLFMLYSSIRFMIAEQEQTMASLVFLPKNLVYLSLPVSALCMLIYSFLLLVGPKKEGASV